VVITLTGWMQADAVVALLIGALIVPRTVRLLVESLSVLMESVPPGLDVDEVRGHILELPHVVEVHDLHASRISSDLPVLTAHVVLEEEYFYSGGSAEALEDFTEKELRSSIKSMLTEPEARELKKAHYHVATDYYEFDIPEYWWGKVEWTTSDGRKSNYNTPMTETEVYFYDSSSKKQTLLRVSSYTFNTSSTVSDVWVGDYSYIGLKEFEEGNRRTRVTPANPAAISVDSVKYNGRLTDGMMKAADLATGGKIKERSQLSDYTAQSATEVTKDFCNKELMPTFKLK